MLTKRRTLLALLVAVAVLGPAGPAVAQSRPATMLRCEADFAGFMIGRASETIDPGCADLGPAYQAGVAAYQARNAECAGIRALSHPIRRAECEARAKWEGERAFRVTATGLRAVAEPPPAVAAAALPAVEPEPVVEPEPAPAPGDDGRSMLTDGVNAVTRSIEENPEAALAAGAAAATLAFPAGRAATVAAGRSIPTFFTRLLDAVKTPFAAVASAIR